MKRAGAGLTAALGGTCRHCALPEDLERSAQLLEHAVTNRDKHVDSRGKFQYLFPLNQDTSAAYITFRVSLFMSFLQRPYRISVAQPQGRALMGRC